MAIKNELLRIGVSTYLSVNKRIHHLRSDSPRTKVVGLATGARRRRRSGNDVKASKTDKSGQYHRD